MMKNTLRLLFLGVAALAASCQREPALIPEVSGMPDALTPLTFEAKEAGATVDFTFGDGVSVTLEYSMDGSEWNEYISGDFIELYQVGDKVSFRTTNTHEDFDAFYIKSIGSRFKCHGDCYIYGNIMSLLSKERFATATSVPKNAFRELFRGNERIFNHPSKALLLPATTLAEGCYQGMFMGCTGLTAAPALPATVLESSCYERMFYYCTNLIAAPELPATTLADHCYYRMFQDCRSLTSAPVLPAATLAVSCYTGMFYDCSHLSSVTCLATDISGSKCTTAWLCGVAASGTFTAANPDVAWESGTDGIPIGWTRVN